MAQTHYQGLVTAPDPGRPLVFALHGTGGDEHQFFGLAQAMVPGGGVIAPRGDVSEMGAARFFRRTGEGVYDMEDLARRTDKMVEFVQAHKDAHPGSPVYGFGYSNGANILASAIMAQPELFDRVALLHPLVTWQLAPLPALADRRVLVTAGERDPITPLAMSQQLIEWFEAHGANVTTAIHNGGHELRQTEIDALSAFLAD